MKGVELATRLETDRESTPTEADPLDGNVLDLESGTLRYLQNVTEDHEKGDHLASNTEDDEKEEDFPVQTSNKKDNYMELDELVFPLLKPAARCIMDCGLNWRVHGSMRPQHEASTHRKSSLTQNCLNKFVSL